MACFSLNSCKNYVKLRTFQHNLMFLFCNKVVTKYLLLLLCKDEKLENYYKKSIYRKGLL